MKIQELRSLSTADQEAHLLSLQHEYVTLRQAIRQGKESNHARLGQVRREIARVKTLLGAAVGA